MQTQSMGSVPNGGWGEFAPEGRPQVGSGISKGAELSEPTPSSCLQSPGPVGRAQGSTARLGSIVRLGQSLLEQNPIPSQGL